MNPIKHNKSYGEWMRSNPKIKRFKALQNIERVCSATLHLKRHYTKRMYLSSRITGIDLNTAYQNFEKAEQKVKDMGYIAVNPMTIHPDNLTWTQYMIRDLYQLAFCKSIYMFGDWQNSKGASIEYFFAVMLFKNRIYETNNYTK